MELINLVTIFLLLLLSVFVFTKKSFTLNFKVIFLYALLLIMMLHNLFLINSKFFPKKTLVPQDNSFLKDLDDIKNTNGNIYSSPDLLDFKSCRDLADRKFYFPSILIKNEIVLIQYEPFMKVKEIVYNVLLEQYG